MLREKMLSMTLAVRKFLTLRISPVGDVGFSE
jgi:hypothetical protein